MKPISDYQYQLKLAEQIEQQNQVTLRIKIPENLYKKLLNHCRQNNVDSLTFIESHINQAIDEL